MALQRLMSKKRQRDPAGAIRFEKKYQAGIDPLIASFHTRVLKDFIHAWETGKIRNLEVGKIDPGKFYTHIDTLAEEEIGKPARKVVQRVIPNAYDQGQVFASIVLGAPLEERVRVWTKIAALIAQNENQFDGFSAEASREFKRIVGEGIIKERSQGQIIKDLQKAGQDLEWKARRIVRTETQIAVNTGIKDRYRQDGVGVVKWLAAGDQRCCEVCSDLDGRKFEIDEAPPCPKHPNCRCTLIAVVRVKPGDNIEKWKGDPPKEPVAPKEPLVNEKPVPINDRINEFTGKYKGAKVEHANIYDKDGRLVQSVVGDHDSVTLPSGIKDTHVVHNHPDQKTVSLSPEDVRAAAKNNVASMTGVDSSGGKMTITRPEGGWGSVRIGDYETTRTGILSDMQSSGKLNDIVRDIKSGSISIDDASEKINNRVVQETWTRLGGDVKYAK